MKRKLHSRILVDILLTVILLLQMTYMLVGEELHEWLGVGMFLLFIIHLYLNRKWIQSIFKGRYTLLRGFQVVINLCVFLCMIMLMMSGIILSKHVFTFLPITNGMSMARIIHMAASYWGFLFMSIHLGLHWSMVINLLMRKEKIKAIKPIMKYLGIIIFFYGLYYFYEQNMMSYLFLKNQFVFFDTSISLISFLFKYIMIMSAFTYIGYQIKKYLLKHKK